MNKEEVLRIVDAIHREKGIDKEVIFDALEQSLALAAKKHLNTEELPSIKIERGSGEISASNEEGEPLDPSVLGRIAFQAARQLFVQKLREAESENIFSEFSGKQGDIVTCSVVQHEGPHLLCKIGDRAEGILHRGDQVPGESYRIGDRLRVYVSEVERKGSRVKVYLSRTDETFVQRLFELEVPEIQDGTVVVKGIAREPGYRTKITVTSTNDRVDCLGACVGVRGSRIRNVVDELNGENVDIVRWSENPGELIKNSLKPAEVAEVILDEEKTRATVYVMKDELSQAIGKGGRNVRLASKLTGWEIDIYELGTPEVEGGEKGAATEEEAAAPESPAETPEPAAETPADGGETADEGTGGEAPVESNVETATKEEAQGDSGAES
jgi:N utilization substance protein A